MEGEASKNILFLLGSFKHSRHFEEHYESLEDKTIAEYLDAKGISYTAPIPLSSYQTDRALSSIADQAELMNNPEKRVVAIAFGGDAFALPANFAAHTYTVPVIGVPFFTANNYGSGIDAFTAVANLPLDTVAGCMPIHYEKKYYENKLTSLDKAVLIAEKILNLDKEIPCVDEEHILLIGPHEKSAYTDRAKLVLERRSDIKSGEINGLGIPYKHIETLQYERYHVPINIAMSDKELLECDSKSYVALQCMRYIKDKTSTDFINTIQTLDYTNNTLYFGNAGNAALFLARSLALISDDVRSRLRTFNHDIDARLRNPERYCQGIKLSEAFKRRR